MDADVIVIGAGIVGAALAYGIARRGSRVIVLDGNDRDFRAARANFGLVWVQGKGSDNPAYAELSMNSADLWPRFRTELMNVCEGRIDYARPGGLVFCLSEKDFVARTDLIARSHNQQSEAHSEMIERSALERMMPAVTLGPDVVGASYCKLDGHVNPLHLYSALQRALRPLGGQLRFRHAVEEISPVAGGYCVRAGGESISAPRVIVAAGLQTQEITAPLGFNIPLHSERGQILVTERLSPILPFPASGMRQTADGTVMIGATNEKIGNTAVSVDATVALARRAQRIIPALASARLVRQWGGLRVLSPDKAPIYAECEHHPGLFAAVCHSGVTLAATHAEIVGPAMAEGRLPSTLAPFSNGRFDVQKCA
ncbi:NAD(P)/FAD-dependent oxidoreductase [Agrobacterium vaccinii]|uniref:NAD(P)/FAD-dependent oxidoreductase n=1 Tax=Agrobacterium vaccinii TaxID=2735528 RepID=UPI001E425675|nr:FAD-dependent oxidoreductase [Agrobacterium vaccinii]UHS59818.1 FAD-binding oxidoreductase [Agrobacterium vaccinii]